MLNDKLFGSGRNKQENWWKTFSQQLINEGYLKPKTFVNSFGNILDLTKKSNDFLTDKLKNRVKLYETAEMRQPTIKSAVAKVQEDTSDDDDEYVLPIAPVQQKTKAIVLRNKKSDVTTNLEVLVYLIRFIYF